MFTIKITGQDEPIRVEDIEGLRIQRAITQRDAPTYINIGQSMIRVSSIRAIVPATDENAQARRMQKAEETAETVEADYVRLRKKALAFTPKQRGRSLRVARLVYQSHTGEKRIPNKLARKIIKRQRAYLTENPNLTVANPLCYRDLIKPLKRTQSHFLHVGMRIVERIVGEDRAHAH
jgi:hypothetical protein